MSDREPNSIHCVEYCTAYALQAEPPASFKADWPIFADTTRYQEVVHVQNPRTAYCYRSCPCGLHIPGRDRQQSRVQHHVDRPQVWQSASSCPTFSEKCEANTVTDFLCACAFQIHWVGRILSPTDFLRKTLEIVHR